MFEWAKNMEKKWKRIRKTHAKEVGKIMKNNKKKINFVFSNVFIPSCFDEMEEILLTPIEINIDKNYTCKKI